MYKAGLFIIRGFFNMSMPGIMRNPNSIFN